MKAREAKKLRRAKAHRAELTKDIRLTRSVAAALLGSQRVAKALTLIDGPAAPRQPQEDCGAMCLPQVAMFNAGHRKTTNVTAR